MITLLLEVIRLWWNDRRNYASQTFNHSPDTFADLMEECDE